MVRLFALRWIQGDKPQPQSVQSLTNLENKDLEIKIYKNKESVDRYGLKLNKPS